MRMLTKLYTPVIRHALRFKGLIIAFGILAIVLGGFLFSKLGADFLPQLDEGSIAIQFVRPTNISIDQSVEMQKISEK